MKASVSLFILFLGFCTLWSEELDLDKIVALAKTNNLQLQQMKTAVAISEFETSIQQGDRLPKLYLNSNISYISEKIKNPSPLNPAIVTEIGSKDKYDFYVQVKQPLFTGFALSNRLYASQKDKQLADLKYKTACNDITYKAKTLYFQIQAMNLRIQTIDSALQRMDDQCKLIKDMYQSGQVLALDTLNISNRKLELLTQRKKAEHDSIILLHSLQTLLHLSETPTVTLSELKEQFSIQSEQEYYQRALANRADYQQLLVQNQSQYFKKKALQGSLYPQLYAQAEYHYGRPGIQTFLNEWRDYYDAGVSFSWLVFDWNQNRSRVNQMERQLDITKNQQQQLEEQIVKDLNDLLERVASAQESIDLQQQLAQQESKNYQYYTQKYKQGLTTSSEVRKAETQLTDALLQKQQSVLELNMLNAQLEYIIAK